MISTFKDLLVWQKAHQLTLQIYKVTDQFPNHEKFGLTSQMRRCAVSIPSNIVEGFRKASTKDSIHFYNIAEGSLDELRYQTLLAQDLHYLSQSIYQELYEQQDEVGKLLYSWKTSQRNN